MKSDTPFLFPAGLSLRLNSSDADEMREQSLFWNYEHQQYTRGTFHGHIVAGHTRHIQLSVSYRSLGVFMQGDMPRNATVISLPLKDDHGFIYQGQPLTKYEAIALKSTEALDLHNRTNSLLLTAVIENAYLEEQAQILCGCPFDQLRKENRLFFNRPEYRWRLAYLEDLLLQLTRHVEPLPVAEEKIIEEDIIVTIFSGITSARPLASKRDRLTFAKEAEALIFRHLNHNISIIDLCTKLGTTERSLHLGFKERFGIGPKSFMQIMRLNKARETLRNNPDLPISDIAFSCGFNHLGRFAEQYKRMFNEVPSMTKNNLV